MNGLVVPESNVDVQRISAADVLNVAAILLLAILVAFFRRELGDERLWLAGIFASLLLFIALSAFLSTRHTLWRVMHDFSPALILPVIFNTLGPIIDCASPHRWDATFAELDARFFNTLATHWQEVLGRPAWLTDLTYLAYVSYYFAPVVLGVMLYRRDRTDAFPQFVFTVVVTFYASYVGYFLFPTLGPRAPLDAETLIIGGGALSRGLRVLIDFLERTRTDAFPSGHTAVALLCLYVASQVSGVTFAAFVPVVLGIIFSTVYLHYHYVVDVVAGVALAGGCGWLGPRLEPMLEPRGIMKRLAPRFGIR